ncbi:cytochrome c oxidase assembly factor 1 homolog isoform X3 [Cavia porcellus]|uniref:cytochrome c oxidase assembly factor 1 homolog isoform X3 n=1 Tax=Cavia porcellus TaxID=10141 RepID=UPI002FE1701A
MPSFRTTVLRGCSGQFCYKVARSSMQDPSRRVLLYTSVLCAGTGPLVYYLIQKGLSRTEYYQMALEQLHGHPEALEALGSPLRVHHLPMLSRDHFVDITDAREQDGISAPTDISQMTRVLNISPYIYLPFLLLSLRSILFQIPIFGRGLYI